MTRNDRLLRYTADHRRQRRSRRWQPDREKLRGQVLYWQHGENSPSVIGGRGSANSWAWWNTRIFASVQLASYYALPARTPDNLPPFLNNCMRARQRFRT